MIQINEKECVRTLFKFMVIAVFRMGKYSFCLEGEVEFGGELKYIDITADTFTKNGIKNDIYDKDYMRHEYQNMTQHVIFTQNEDINILGNSKFSKSKKMLP